jgi:hypothetical protein
MSTPDADTYALKSGEVPEVAAPDLPYQPPMPRAYRPRIGLIGAGGITGAHLDAYRTAGWEIAAICNRSRPKAEARGGEFCPRPPGTAPGGGGVFVPPPRPRDRPLGGGAG